MSLDARRHRIESILATADIRIDGNRPWDPHVYDDRFYDRVLSEGTLGVGESFTDGWWDCEALDQLICRAIRARLDTKFKPWQMLGHVAGAKLKNLQNASRVRQAGW